MLLMIQKSKIQNQNYLNSMGRSFLECRITNTYACLASWSYIFLNHCIIISLETGWYFNLIICTAFDKKILIGEETCQRALKLGNMRIF